MNVVHPTAVVDPAVEMGDGNTIGPYVVIQGPCRIGSGVWIGAHSVVGAPPEHRDAPRPEAWEGRGAGVEIGDGSVLRELVTVHGGTERTTSVGRDCLLMSHCHLGHDVVVGDGVSMAASASLAGLVTVWAHATIGMGALVHQRTSVGPGAMVGMGSAVRRDVPPFTTVAGDPARVAGPNTVALRRLGAAEDALEAFPALLKGDFSAWSGAADRVVELVRAWRSSEAKPLQHG